MGQSSSISSKTALPSNKLLIDASDSYVTDVKLRSTGIIPISEYIKKDKYSKNLSRLKQGKKGAQEENGKKSNEIEDKKGNLETIKEEKGGIEKEARVDEKKILPQNHLQNEVKTEDKKKEKQKFIESSFEDIPDKRKWIKTNSHPNNISALNPLAKTGKNRKTQTKCFKLPKNVEEVNKFRSEEIKQLYKNDVYPHIYKNKFRRKLSEREEQQKKQQNEKIQDSVPESDRSSSTTDKSKASRKKEESTHHLNQVQCNPNLKVVKKHMDKNLVVQTNVACVIHPDRNLHNRSSSEEIIVKKPQNSYLKKFLLSPNFFKKENNKKELKNDVFSDTSNAIIQRKIEKIDKAVEEHRKCLSAKQALENWKNIHTLKQYRKLSQPNYSQYQENQINNRNSYIDDRNNDEYSAGNSNCQTEYVPPRQNRSRAGNRETDINESEIHCEMTPMEISNYNYNKLKSNDKMQYISRQELKERNHRTKNQNTRDNNNTYERPGISKYEFIENPTYSRYPQQSRYKDYDSPKYQSHDVKTILHPNNERYYRSNTAPEMSERVDNNMGRTTGKNSEGRDFMNINMDRSMERNMNRSMNKNINRSMDRNMNRSMDRNMNRSIDRNMERSMDRNMKRSINKNIERSMDRNMDRSIYKSIERPMDRNMEKNMDREDFIIDMERCLKKRQIMVSNSPSPHTPTSGRTTWVQDKYRRWHKIVVE